MPFYGDPYTAVSAISDAGGIVLSRSSGVTPAFVQVSASAITATGTSRPYETLEYSWDFGDPSGTESLTNPADGGASVNPNTSQVGPEAAYVYRTAGTYTITLTIRGDNGSGGYVTETVTATFTVTAFAADVEYYFDSVNGNNSWNGQSPTFVSGSIGPKADLTGFDFWMDVFSVTTYHFARGGTYDYNVGHRNGTRIDAYGTGAKPILRLTGGDGISFNIGSEGQYYEDIVFSGVNFLNTGTGRTFYFNISVETGTRIDHVYIDNCAFTREDPANMTWFQLANKGGQKGFGVWNSTFDAGSDFIASDYLGSTSALGDTDFDWRFFMGVTMINGEGDVSLDTPNRAIGHVIYTGSENHQLYRYCSFGGGARNRYFCFNGNIDGTSSSRCYYWDLSDNEFTGMWAALDLGNEVNNPSLSGSIDAVVIERNYIHGMSNTQDWTNPSPPPATFANNDQWIVYASAGLNYTYRNNTFDPDCPRADGNGNEPNPYLSDIFALQEYGAPRLYDNIVGNEGYEVNPLAWDDGDSFVSGFQYNNLPDTDNPTTFSGNTSGTGTENGAAITGTLGVADADGITTPNFTVTTDGAHGTATINSTSGAWSYTPDADWFGSDSFIVRVTDDLDNNDYQIISITVNEAGGSSPTYYAFSAGGDTFVFQTGGA